MEPHKDNVEGKNALATIVNSFWLGRCEEPRLCLSQLNDGIDRRRIPLQDQDHPGNDPHLVPSFPRLCSGMFPERFRSASISVGSREIRLT